MPIASLADIRARVGQEIGVSDWVDVPQSAIDAFADVTLDPQFIHVDPEAAARTPFGGTIAHGFLTLSYLSYMSYQVALAPDAAVMGVNYGFDRIRFIEPVPSGSRIRGRFTLLSMDEEPGRLRTLYRVVVEIDGRDRPALTADWIGLVFLAPKDPA